MRKIKILAGLGAVLLAANLFAAKPVTPEPADAAKYGAKFISISDAKKLYDQGVLFIDARKPMEFAEGRIKGAKRAYYNEKGGKKNKVADWDASKDKFETKNIPADKTTKIVAYCSGVKCWRSYKASIALTKDGYTDVNWMRDGYPQWKKAGYPVE